ncbi:MAG: thioredoxin domain-containing protein [Myxococcota bacterium]
MRFMFVLLLLASCASTEDIRRLEESNKRIEAQLKALAERTPKRAVRADVPRGPDPKKVHPFPVETAHRKGPDDAWVTIVEVSDFQCPFCNRANATMNKILENYGKDVRLVWKHNPLSFHKRALPAALAAECAGEQDKFWEYHDRLFANQRQLEDPDLESYARNTGLDVTRWKSCYDGEKFKAKILKDQRTTVALKARGTPVFFINGRYLAGAKPYEEFAALIDEELAKAKKSGVSRGNYYAHITAR